MKNERNRLVPQVNDILVASWGYDQTNVNFYRVVEVKSEKTIIIQEVGSEPVDELLDCEHFVPNNKFVDEKMSKRLCRGGSMVGYSVKIESYINAFLWDGKPEYQSYYGR